MRARHRPLVARGSYARCAPRRQRKIVQYKTAYYTFYLPIASGLIICGLTSEKQLKAPVAAAAAAAAHV